MFITFLVMHKYLFPALKIPDWVGYMATMGQQTMADNQAKTARIQCHASVRKLLIHTVLRMTRVRLSHGSFCHQLPCCWTTGQTLTTVGTGITPCGRHCLLLPRIRVKCTLPRNYWPMLELTHGTYVFESTKNLTYQIAVFINTINSHYNLSTLMTEG